MLINLYLENYVLFDKQNLTFNDALIAVTGDTGAGKSLIIDALGYLCGNRLLTNVNKDRSKNTFIEGNFTFNNASTINLLNDNGIDESDVYIVSRTIDTNGKSISRINGRSVTLSLLKSVFDKELDIHTQRDNQYLLNKQTHLNLVDSFAKHDDLVNDVANKYKIYNSLVNEKEKLENTVFNDEEIEFLKFQLQDIEKVNASEEEYLKLTKEIEELNNYEMLHTNLANPSKIFSEPKGMIDLTYDVRNYLSKISNLDDYAELFKRVDSLYIEVKDISDEISHNLSSLHYDEFEVNRIEERLYEINHLIKRHGGSFEIFKQRHLEILNKIEQADDKEYILIKLDKQINEALANYMDSAQSLSNSRKQSVINLEQEILAHLTDLQLENTQFKVDFNIKSPSKDGIDDIEFLVAMNKGFELESLIKVASGGELSRLMLGLKVLFSNLFGVSTVVFDEIDTGVSGSVASSIGYKMFELSKTTQVFTVTHLAQVAAYSNEHFYVEKDNSSNIGNTNINLLSKDETIEKLALMATGIISENSIKTATELYDSAKLEIGN